METPISFGEFLVNHHPEHVLEEVGHMPLKGGMICQGEFQDANAPGFGL